MDEGELSTFIPDKLVQDGFVDMLLRTRQFTTDFQYFLNLSFSYRFGSRFANIVNPRMGSSGGTIIF